MTEADAPRAVRALIPLGVLAITLACFLPAVGNGFVNWDDDHNLLDNPRYRGLSLDHLRWMFTAREGLYMPLTWLSFALDWMVWGLRPGGYHLTSVILHAANAVLCYFVILALVPHGGRWAAAAAALFFALHPLRVESVAWITERRDVLSGLFALLSMLAYLRAHRTGGKQSPWLALSIVCYGCSLLSKAMALVFPLMLLALDVYPLARFARGARLRVLAEKLPYAALAAGALWMAWLAQSSVHALHESPAALRTVQPGYRLGFYLWKTAAPFGLSPLYLFRADESAAQLKFILGNAAVLALTAGLIALRRRWPAGLVAWACTVALLLPALGFVQVGPHAAADRYTYLASLPWSVLLAAGLARLPTPRIAEWASAAARAGAAAILAVLGLLSVVQVGIWKDSVTLWTQALRVDPENHVAYHNRGRAYYVRALQRWDASLFRAALADYDASIRCRPGEARVYSNRGLARRALTDPYGALEDFKEAISRDPKMAEAYANTGLVLADLGEVAGAVAAYSLALDVAPPDWPSRAQVERGLEELRPKRPPKKD